MDSRSEAIQLRSDKEIDKGEVSAKEEEPMVPALQSVKEEEEEEWLDDDKV